MGFTIISVYIVFAAAFFAAAFKEGFAIRRNETRQALIQDIKQGVLMDIHRARTAPRREQQLVESIRRDIMAKLEQPNSSPRFASERAFADAIKAEVLAQIRTDLRQKTEPASYPDRATIEALRAEIVADLEAEQESEREAYSQRSNGTWDPALVQAIKDSVLAELNMPNMPS
ncbi:MAG TPA: hypothetical protein VJ036_06735 [bacterium]|nr:hypothetical protein [bacterium]